MSRNYGLTGKTVKVKHKAGHTDAYPWNGIAVPILITGEYPTFLVGTVLPHHAPKGVGSFGLSRPYTVTLNKHDVAIGVIIIDGGAIR